MGFAPATHPAVRSPHDPGSAYLLLQMAILMTAPRSKMAELTCFNGLTRWLDFGCLRPGDWVDEFRQWDTSRPLLTWQDALRTIHCAHAGCSSIFASRMSLTMEKTSGLGSNPWLIAKRQVPGRT